MPRWFSWLIIFVAFVSLMVLFCGCVPNPIKTIYSAIRNDDPAHYLINGPDTYWPVRVDVCFYIYHPEGVQVFSRQVLGECEKL